MNELCKIYEKLKEKILQEKYMKYAFIILVFLV